MKLGHLFARKKKKEKKKKKTNRSDSESMSDGILLTPYSRVLLEKLIGFQLVGKKKFPAFYGTRMLVTALTRARCQTVNRSFIYGRIGFSVYDNLIY